MTQNKDESKNYDPMAHGQAINDFVDAKNKLKYLSEHHEAFLNVTLMLFMGSIGLMIYFLNDGPFWSLPLSAVAFLLGIKCFSKTKGFQKRRRELHEQMESSSSEWFTQVKRKGRADAEGGE